MTPIKKTIHSVLAGISVPLVLATTFPAHVQAGAAGSANVSAAQVSRSSTYQNGTYTARGWYGSLPSSITVTVTLRGGLITGVKVQTHATDPTSLDLQRRFAAAVPGVVVGKPLAEVRVGKLAGSSGTPKGFNDALDKIKQQAAK